LNVVKITNQKKNITYVEKFKTLKHDMNKKLYLQIQFTPHREKIPSRWRR